MTPAALLHERPPRLMFAEQPESLHLRGPAASKLDADEKGPAPFLSKPGIKTARGGLSALVQCACYQVCALSLGASHCLDAAAGLEASSA